MYYRQKILLSLVESFGGSLSNTDCQKLIFLFCQRTGENYYDFFPYQYGGFSHVLYDDKRQLTTKGYFWDEDRFRLGKNSLIEELKPKDQYAINELTKERGKTRGKRLVLKVYRELPYFAAKSKIASDIFSKEEIDEIKSQWKKDSSTCLYTLGYEGISIDNYLNKLIKNNIRVLVDVRKNPFSRKFGFSKSKLKPYAESLEIEYIHLPELGIDSKFRKDLNKPSSYKKLFNYYKKDILPKQKKAIMKIKSKLSEHKKIALTCFEADHKFCHRHKITELLDKGPKFTTPITHLN